VSIADGINRNLSDEALQGTKKLHRGVRDGVYLGCGITVSC
jgi:hypothetical protein